MFFRLNSKRLFSISTISRNAKASALAALRKKTGYSLSNCRMALELHRNDEIQAEKWLREQAQAMGWDKVQKVEGRSTSQGLIGVSLKDKKAVLVEVNCETDFVSRNNQFKSLVQSVVHCCLNHQVMKNSLYSEIFINSEELSKLKTQDGQLLGNLTTLLVGNVSENIVLKRAICCEIFDKSINLAVDTHPPTTTSQDVLLGKYGSLVLYRTDPDVLGERDLSTQDIGVQLCKHVIGMNPRKIGSLGVDNPIEDIDEEKVMINQEFLLDSSITVGQFLQACSTKILHFKRFECGESISFSEGKSECLQESEKRSLLSSDMPVLANKI